MIQLKELRGRRVFAADGAAGVLNDLFFDAAKWQVRYLMVDTSLRMANGRLPRRSSTRALPAVQSFL